MILLGTALPERTAVSTRHRLLDIVVATYPPTYPDMVNCSVRVNSQIAHLKLVAQTRTAISNGKFPCVRNRSLEMRPLKQKNFSQKSFLLDQSSILLYRTLSKRLCSEVVRQNFVLRLRVKTLIITTDCLGILKSSSLCQKG